MKRKPPSAARSVTLSIRSVPGTCAAHGVLERAGHVVARSSMEVPAERGAPLLAASEAWSCVEKQLRAVAKLMGWRVCK